jgi:hypothetical protein
MKDVGYGSSIFMGKTLHIILSLILQVTIGCSENNPKQTLNARSNDVSSKDATGADFDGWNQDNSADFDDALNLVSPDNRACTQKIIKDYELLIAVRLIGGPRNAQRFFGGVRMPKVRRSGAEPIPINPADTILCYDGRQWQFNLGGVVDFKNLDLPRFMGMGGDSNRQFGINSGYDQNASNDLGKKFRLLGKDYFSYVDQDTKAKGMGKVDFRLRVLSTSANSGQNLPTSTSTSTRIPPPPPAPASDPNPPPGPPTAPNPPPPPIPNPGLSMPSDNENASDPGTSPGQEINWGSDWLALVAPEDSSCTANLIRNQYSLIFKISVVSGSKNQKIFVGGIRAKAPEATGRSSITLNQNDTVFCYSGQEWQLGAGAQLEFDGSNLVRLIAEGGDQQHRFGVNSGFDRYQFGRGEEAFIRSGEDYFGYLHSSTFVDGAGRVEYRWNENSSKANVPPPPESLREVATRCLILLQNKLDRMYPISDWNIPAMIYGEEFRRCIGPALNHCDALRFARSCYDTQDGECISCYDILRTGYPINPARIIQCSTVYNRCRL